ncbi:amidohydrolase family protein [Bradyrhizobium sp. LHD-71]|uniref:amidohydrolase family protein n=1 Tax=Bradyrhizobium sp. LHD-71 TaxID=3072141 RepID=UPI00280D9665|nr:amidohydrolase family protein [Bradyrhizobium sp. LHD-71]MDQ8729284.1 amidohydrolase family protein [Bradyrhizobium sp. LHD-71]
MIDVVIRSDQVVTSHGVGAYDVAVSGGKIAGVAAAGTFDGGSDVRVIDATGKVVIPGGIDPHVHCAWHVPNPDGTAGLSDPPPIVSKAAIHGGTTTVIDFARWTHGNTIRDTIETRDKTWVGQCYCDYSYHVMVEGTLPPDLPGQIAETVQAGYPTIKIFTTDIRPSTIGRMVRFGDIWEIFKILTENGGMGVIHAEDNDIVMHMYDKLIREGRTGFENMAEVHNVLSEDLSFRRVIRLAEQVGTALYMMHVSAASGVSAIREARAKDLPIYGETLHQYIMYTSEDYKRENGQIYHTYPSLKSREDQDALWTGTRDGSINTIATDELCCSLQRKVQGKRIDDTTGGNAAVEPRVSLMYTEMVERRNYSLGQFVDLVSTNAAKLMGLYPRKGVIAAGSDADIVILDPGLRRVLRADELHESDYSPWEGREMAVWPSLTMLRGKIVMENGAFLGDARDGIYLPRKISGEILAQACL